ncbi:MAG: hypoxanthine-guanine phosphoribosyltransferase [Betaproteobacteria bacterium]|nr:hypoxanthine-guanine phosphoribosyltransferase [Betaproteobacteria bacterium]
MLAASEAQDVLKTAELVCPAAAAAQAVERMAAEITAALATAHPLVLSVMTGAVVVTGQLLPLLRFPLDFDYIHLTRYGDATRGGSIEWKMFPAERIAGRAVLVIDDIEAGAGSFHAAVFADKDIGRAKPIAADFIGISLPNRYVFGFGMDVKGAWRNLPAVYAMKEG